MKKIMILMVCMFIANLIMADNAMSYKEIEKQELLKIFEDETTTEYYLEYTFDVEKNKWENIHKVLD